MGCQFCGKDINNKGSLRSHELRCKDNPDRVKFVHGIDAGAHKGSVPWNTKLKIGRHKNWDARFPLDKVMVENSTYARCCVKKRILDNNILEYRCEICGIGPEWNDKPMPLILDHINGKNNDNRLENLRFVCHRTAILS